MESLICTSYQSGPSAITVRQTPSLAIEAGVTMGWHRWVDEVIGIDRFGASAPGATVMKELGISAEHLAARARALLGS